MGTANPEDVQKAITMSEGTDQAQNIRDAQEVSQYVVKSSVERQGLRDSAEKLGTEGAEVLQKMQAAEYKIQQALAKDPMGTAISQGVVDLSDFNPLVPTTESVELAKEQAAIASEHYGTQVPILTASQTTQLIEYFNSEDITAEEQASIARVYGADSGIWSQFSEQNAGVYAQGATHPNSTVSTGIFKGNNRLKQGIVSVKGSDKTDSLVKFYDYIGSDTVPDADAKDLYDASVAYYASTIGQGESYDSNTFKTAIKSVVGQVESVRGFKTLLTEGITEDQMDFYFDNMTMDQYLVAKGIDVTKDDTSVEMYSKLFNELELINGSGRIRAVKGNAYVIETPSGTSLYDKNGKIIEFTIDADSISRMRDVTAKKQRAVAEARMNVLEQRTTRF